MGAFAADGRRRSEAASLRKEQLTTEEAITGDAGIPLPSLSIHLGRTKNSETDLEEVVF